MFYQYLTKLKPGPPIALSARHHEKHQNITILVVADFLNCWMPIQPTPSISRSRQRKFHEFMEHIFALPEV